MNTDDFELELQRQQLLIEELKAIKARAIDISNQIRALRLAVQRGQKFGSKITTRVAVVFNDAGTIYYIPDSHMIITRIEA